MRNSLLHRAAVMRRDGLDARALPSALAGTLLVE